MPVITPPSPSVVISRKTLRGYFSGSGVDGEGRASGSGSEAGS